MGTPCRWAAQSHARCSRCWRAMRMADRLIEGLWGEQPPATAPKLVQVLVSQLRKQLAGADAEIVTRGRGYELRMDPDGVDALRFERLLTSGENGAHLREALALWRGPPLYDVADEPFAAPEIRRLEDLWLDAREAAIDAALADGRHAAVLGEVDDLDREHPLRERLHAQRMLALYRSGRQSEALEAFRQPGGSCSARSGSSRVLAKDRVVQVAQLGTRAAALDSRRQRADP